jgi:hypothetical protein
MVALRTPNLVQVRVDLHLVVMGMLADRRDELGRARTQTINRGAPGVAFPGRAKRFLSAAQARALIAAINTYNRVVLAGRIDVAPDTMPLKKTPFTDVSRGGYASVLRRFGRAATIWAALPRPVGNGILLRLDNENTRGA